MIVRVLEPEASRDGGFVGRLAALINGVYVISESGLWRGGTTRTTVDDLAALIEAGDIVVAGREGGIAGAVQMHDVAADVSEFGMLAAARDQRGSGVGRALLDFVEDRGRERGLRAIQLELLVPRGWTHPSKEFLKGWYGRRGYRRVRTTTMEEAHPHLAPLLATACDLEIHQKPLT
jgi:GNAT superfamily N-acetyltransferase